MTAVDSTTNIERFAGEFDPGPVRKLTESEARLLSDARALLVDLAKSHHACFEDWRAGLMYAMADRADTAIFEVLNAQSSYGDDANALDAIKRRYS